MRSLFPKKNDFVSLNELEEVIPELNKFNISTKKEIRLFLKKYRKWVLNGEKSSLDLVHQKIYREMEGDTDYLDSIKRQYWFAYPAIIRTVMEEEFGSEYEDYANKRDNI